jgi:DNA-binding transcriptional regulator YiaG
LCCNGRQSEVVPVNHRGIHEIQNINSVTHCLIYTFETEINLLDFNPAYPKNPQSLGQKIRKVRMDRGMFIRELASQIGVSEDTIINWEVRNVKPTEGSLEKLKKFLLCCFAS